MNFNELDWVDYLKKRVPKPSRVLTGIGDDCALVRVGRNKLLLKSDLFIEDIHFKLRSLSFETIGRRAVARVLSDFAACGGVPKFIGLSAGVPNYVKMRHLRQILNGLLDLSRKYKFSLVGGDTSKSNQLFLDVWGLGQAKKFIARSTAKVGDYIFITGKLGKNKLTKAFEPKLKISQFLVKNFKLNSMIDISDGFTLDLYRILEMSKKGACLIEADVPTTSGKSDFYRGEDYELIFTVDESDKKVAALKNKFYCVGRIKPKKFGYKIKKNNKLYNLSPKGYTHS